MFPSLLSVAILCCYGLQDFCCFFAILLCSTLVSQQLLLGHFADILKILNEILDFS